MSKSSGIILRSPGLLAAAVTQAVLSVMLSAVPAEAQTLIVPAPSGATIRPVWNCRFQQPVGATKIYASRLLDGAGAYLGESSGWTDVDTANQSAPLTISVSWGSRDGRSHFADGMATLFFRTDRIMSAPLTVQLGKPVGLKIAAGWAYIKPREIVAYEPIGRVITVIDNRAELKWALTGATSNNAAEPASFEGNYAALSLLQLKSGYEQLIANIDLMQADFSKRCTRLP